jgi:segregation and condensation protein A
LGVAEDDIEGGGGAPETDAGGEATALPRVRLEVFEGPLDLLLHLIKKNELEITDIPIASITAEYLAYVELMQDLNLDLAGEFLVMASTLTLIKSRMLLPDDAAGDEELEEDPRADLVRQLLEYQRYREAAAELGERPRLQRDVFAREPSLEGAEGVQGEPPPIRVSVWDLIEAYRRVLERARPASVHEVQLERVSLRERVEFVLARLGVARRLDFELLFPEEATRLEIIVTFLAVLELMKMRAVQAFQDEQFGGIVLALAVEDVSEVEMDLLDEYESHPAKEEG